MADALAAADLTTSPDGEPINRIDEILARHASDSPVHRAIDQVNRALRRYRR